jgi:hypothetical protein
VAKQPRTILEVCVARLGVHRGALAAANVAQLAMTAADLGRFPTALEYAADWSLSERSAFNHRGRARDGLGENWQQIIEGLALELVARKARSPRAVMALPLPRLVSA